MDCCTKKCARITLIGLVLTLLCTFCFAKDLPSEFWDREKKITLNGEKRSVYVGVLAIAEYDSNGKILHSRTPGYGGDIKEEWYKYDSNGNEIWHGSFQFEEWKDYNFLNQNTHGKNSNGYEWENKFDSRGRLVLQRFLSGAYTKGAEWRYFYDSDGKLIEEHRLWPYFGQTVKFQYKYDAKGNRISSSRETHFESPEKEDSTGEEFWEYDAKGHEIAYFEDAEVKKKGIPSEIYEYKFWMNGNIKTKTTYKIAGFPE
ncbi:MAG: hypothetical protein K2I74_10965 [Treponemataceae bacterium]|nr:hypothetical protein [Treponemataceae bacterium]